MTDTTQGPIDQKFFLKSKTVWGVLIAAVPEVLRAVGMPIADATITDAQSLFEQTLVVADQLNVAAGGLLALYGRAKSQAQVWFVKPKAPPA